MEARRREHEEREHREPREERHEARLEPVRERDEYMFETRMAEHPDLVHWGSVWTGFIGTFAVLMILGVLGLAVGLGAAPAATPGQLGTTSVIWGVIITLVSFFVGGWLAGRTSSFRGTRFSGWLIGSMVWALGVVLAILLAAIGVGGLAGTALSIFGVPPVSISPGAAATTAQSAAIGTLIGLVLAYIACVIGAMVGGGTWAEQVTHRERR